MVAGNETTRTAISHALMLLTDFPGQRELLLADLDDRIAGAVEEIVRYAAPVIWMRRTVTRDHAMNGHNYRAGDKAVLLYWAANRDEAVFDDPARFDISRSPNPHVGFGAAGPHFCLGAHLARREITAILRELLAGFLTCTPPVRRSGFCPVLSTASSTSPATSLRDALAPRSGGRTGVTKFGERPSTWVPSIS